jgi:hypothetical protein
VQRKALAIYDLWLPISASRNGLPFIDLDRKGAWDDALSYWSNEKFSNVALGPLDMVGYFCIGLSNGRRDHVDPGCLLVRLEFETRYRQEEEGNSRGAIICCAKMKTKDTITAGVSTHLHESHH